MTTELVTLQILVTEADWLGLFDQIEVWRSRDTVQGPYEELTDESWKPARIPKLAGDEPTTPVTGALVVIDGETLEFRVNEDDTADIEVTISGADPISLADIASQVTAQGLNKVRSYVDELGTLVVETREPGSRAILRVLETDGAAVVALPTSEPESLSYGRDARLSLIAGTTSYEYSDIRGSTAYFYKTRFRNRLSGAFSEFSLPFTVGQATGISSANVICGELDLVGLDGAPLAFREVSVYSSYNGELVEGKLVSGPSLRELTDANGHVSFLLVRGTDVTVAISGTNIVRDITVPTDPDVSIFGLLDPSVSPQDDVFVVQRPDIVYAERRSL
jgi:hypothetical protein